MIPKTPKPMTMATFLCELRKLRNNGWTISVTSEIRCEKGDCPIIAVAKARGIRGSTGAAFNNCQYNMAGCALGLGGVRIEMIANAADGSINSRGRKRVRAALLKALGLVEVEVPRWRAPKAPG